MVSSKSSSLWDSAEQSKTAESFNTAMTTSSPFLTLGTSNYYIRWDSVISANPSKSTPVNASFPALVINARGDVQRKDNWLDDLVKRYIREDDIVDKDFLDYVFLITDSLVDTKLDGSVLHFSGKSFHVQIIVLESVYERVEDGPYYFHLGKLHHMYKTHTDIQEAFALTTIPKNPGNQSSHQPFQVSDGRTLSIAIPSRLRGAQDKKKPLSGLRVAVKDNMDLQGVKTGISCRAILELYPDKQLSAYVVQKLVDLGAAIVGKTKTTQFAEVERPTADWVDFSCPWNPRGDGYLNPDGSTAGGAAALAAYDWLDISIGTDTGGSIRGPAARAGVFSIRATYNSQNLEGIFPLSKSLDTLGFMARDVRTLNRVTRAWFTHEDISVQEYPKRILYLTDFPLSDLEANKAADKFLGHLEAFTGTQRNNISLAAKWLDDDPASNGRPLAEYIGKSQTMMTIKGPEFLKATDDFRNRYRSAFGKPPYVNPVIQSRWEDGEKITTEQYHAALERRKIFSKWFTESVFGIANDTIVVVPYQLSTSHPEYRDEYFEGPWKGGTGWHRNFLSSLSGVPEVLIPVGEAPYFSRISEKTEYLPVSLSILGPKGFDQVLTQLLEDMYKAQGLPLTVKTGSRVF